MSLTAEDRTHIQHLVHTEVREVLAEYPTF